MVSKTRKNRMTLPRDDSTLHQINGWHKHVFTHLGWMVLAKAKGLYTKVAQYKMSVNRLADAIVNLMKEYESQNSKHDLKVMLRQVEILQHDMNKIL